ncbi:putative protease [Candidatus Brocadiaceae bacterium]|nr:putative protease [Candidatus Brocadiaceae bacterium]
MSHENRIRLELLAPAKDYETGVAAITHGADAVYIGAPKFGARASAGNELSDIDALIRFAHQYYARVYVTVNTVLFDEELPAVSELIWQLYRMGADAIIIQDTALLQMELPPIARFASTQMHNYDLKQIQFLESVGINRIILARELSLDKIQEISTTVKADLEFFVHGALCVSLSGQCYMSAATTGRSANRGDCSQNCRHGYTLTDAAGNVIVENKHLLSMKDLDLSRRLRELTDAGITSFKIEGRLKDVSYVKNITAFYRQKLDEMIAADTNLMRASSGRVTLFFTPDPERTFNRGYTEYFIDGNRNATAATDSPKSLGKRIGTVIGAAPGRFQIKTDEVLRAGDGICYFNEKSELEGVLVNGVKDGFVTIGDNKTVPIGVTLFRNKDHEFSKRLSGKSAERKISAVLRCYFFENSVRVEIVDEDGITVEKAFTHSFAQSEKQERAKEYIISKSEKSGETIFSVTAEVISDVSLPHLPPSFLGNTRNEMLEMLLTEREKHFHKYEFQKPENPMNYPESKIDFRCNVTNEKAALFYREHGVVEIAPGYEAQPFDEGVPVMRTKYCIKKQLDICPLETKHRSLDPLKLSDGLETYTLQFDCKACEMIIFMNK